MLKRLLTSFLACTTAIATANVYSGNQNDSQHHNSWNGWRGAALYEVTITNTTLAQNFTPQLLFTHSGAVKLFEIGEPASSELEALAEGGSTAELTDALSDQVFDIKTNGLLLEPGKSTTVTVAAKHHRRYASYLSIASMLVPTNDTFMALNQFRLPRYGRTTTVNVFAYDAGTEANDQRCANIPGGGVCSGMNGEGVSLPAEGDEGFIYISNGIHDLGDTDTDGNIVLSPQRYDWKNHVAEIEIRRIR